MEEEQGYPSSDKESNVSNDKTTEHSSTLKSSNPAWIKLKELGLDAELPKPVDKLPESSEETVEKLPEIVETTSEPLETEELSAFGRWLTSLAEPSVDPQPVVHIETSGDLVSTTEESKAIEVNTPEVSTPVKSSNKVKDKKKKKKRKKKKKKATQTDDAVLLSEGIYSETLAELLVSQGHIDEAIQMYDKMRLKYPEKSRLFAAKIAELIKKA